MFLPRRIYRSLKSHLDLPEVTVLTGMRRTGKTAIIQKLFEDLDTDNKLFLDLENRINRELFLSPDYDEIWRILKGIHGLHDRERAFLFLDEIQHLAELPRVMKYLLDHYALKFVVTGSSSFYLKNLFPESLSGRKQIFELYPLTFDEFLVFRGKSKTLLDETRSLAEIKKSDLWQRAHAASFDEYLRYGGFPGVVLAEEPVRKVNLLKDVFYSYVEQDVRTLSTFKKMNEMEQLIRLLTTRVGQKLDVAKLSREISLSRPTLLEYLVFLEKTYVISRTPAFARTPGREISKTPKIYFCDTGLAQVLAQMATGQVLENSVYHQLRVKYAADTMTPVSYYQKKSGPEIDFILNGQVAVEVRETADPSDLSRLSALTQNLGLGQSVLISKNPTKVPNAVYASQL